MVHVLGRSVIPIYIRDHVVIHLTWQQYFLVVVHVPYWFEFSFWEYLLSERKKKFKKIQKLKKLRTENVARNKKEQQQF